jgi:ATP-dependent Clp protease ATP-binding subunit ClpC
MFERFTDRARRVVVWAQEEARTFNHNYIGTEHLLLGLIKEGEGIGAKTLTAVGVDLEMVRGELDIRVGRGASTPKGHIPFTPRAKKVLELALREAMRLGHNYIGTEHVLLGLLREGQGVGAQILMTRVDGGLERVEKEVLNQLSGMGVEIAPTKVDLRRHAGEPPASITVDEIVKRLEAIEARLTAIERMLRGQQGETEVS